ncbi:NACHT domain-containing protein [Spirillospora sp. NPDC048911]|uniref:NACHT domain-containing protein n=1 Tax=Spirillospora sp. NPDC048911 TaxID=3364527 RepID=UPI003721FE1F
MERRWRVAFALGTIAVMAVAVVATGVRGGLEQASWTAAVISLLTVPAAVLAWAFRRSEPSVYSLDEHLAGVADELAPRIRAEWVSEAKVRGLISPVWDETRETELNHLLPVRWSRVTPAPASPPTSAPTPTPAPAHAPAPAQALTPASASAPAPAPASASTPASAPAPTSAPAPALGSALGFRAGGAPRGRVHRADSVAGLVAGYLGVTGRRLAILGAEGSGKSALAVLITLGLLKDRVPGGPVPVLFSMAPWDPGEPLIDWMARRLSEAVPPLGKRIAKKRLREHVPAYRHGTLRKPERTLAYQLLHTGRILPVMDGLDEIPAARHGCVVPRINEAAERLPGYVLTSREKEYPEIAPADDPGREVLHDVWRVRLEPVLLADARRFLADPAGDGPDRWEPVFATLAAPAARRSPHVSLLADVLASPLMLSLASRVYRSRGEDPKELLEPSAYPDRAAIERRLLSGLVRQAFRDARWPLEKAERWLADLAAQTHRHGASRIRWWELTRYLRPATAVFAGVFGAVLSGTATGLGFYAVLGTLPGLIAGLVGAVALGVPCALTVPAPAELQFQVSGQIWRALISGSFIGAVAFLAGLVACNWVVGLAVSLSLGLPVSVLYGFSVQKEISEVVTPGLLLRRDRVVALAFGLVYGVPQAVIGGIIVGHRDGVPAGVVFGIVFGIAAGLAGALLYGLFWALALKVMNIGLIAWVHLIFVQVWLVVRGRGPWRLMQFFEYAHQRGVLRQIGAAYEFSHVRLRDELAQRQRGPRRQRQRP